MATFANPSRHGVIVRLVASLTGDVTVGIGVASACGWLISAAGFGFFMSFLSWLAAALFALAISQYLVHPAAEFLLSDRKLDQALDAITGVGNALRITGVAIGQNAVQAVRGVAASAVAAR
ncbi:MAG: hypothetical protein U1E86_18975 [Burkholderiaceae bacterium]